MVQKNQKLLLWFEELTKEDIPLAGGKNANLGELTKAGIPVPPGFAITAYAFKKYIEETNIASKIYETIEDTITDENDPKLYEEASKKVRKLVESTPMPREIEKVIKDEYARLSERTKQAEAFVAVRSSATAEDLADASFAGQQETFLNVKGPKELIEKTIKCWSSLFTPRAIYYRVQKGFKHEDVLISVGVQKMVNSKAAGVAFTINPVTGDRSQMMIEGNWGLGESVVSGAVTPDDYLVDKETLKVIHRNIAKKTIEYIRDPKTGRTIHAEVPADRQDKACLTEKELQRIAQLCKTIEAHYGKTQDIEWAIDRDLSFPENIFIVQSRPETVWSLKAMPEKERVEMKTTERTVAIKGLPASPGIYAGKAIVAVTTEDAHNVKKGDILVTKMTNPDWVPYMRIAGAIVTNDGGMTCHAAIVSRELGIPCIVGTGKATEVLKSNQSYTVDAKTGVVYEGIIEEAKPAEKLAVAGMPTMVESFPVTGTKILMNLGVPEKSEDYKDLPFDGIGLMRVEFIMASYIAEHPNYLIEMGHAQKFTDKMADGIAQVARAIHPRPVVVRLSDFKTNEYRQLKGGEKFEPHEENPMMGWRGVSRYISKQYREAFKLECKAIKKVRVEWKLGNVWIMLPFVRTVWELKECLSILKEEGLERGRDFKVWLMAEVPSIIFMADEFSHYCDGFSIGSNDLTQLVLGTDRDSQILPSIDSRYFDERDPAVKRAIAHLIKVAHKYGVTVSICGQAPSVYPEFTEFLVRCGIDSVSVNHDVVKQTRKLVASIEQKVLLERMAELQKQARGNKIEKNVADDKDFTVE